MAEILLFHHVLGRTEGVVALADRRRAGGQVVHVPDLFDGQRFDSFEAGVAHVQTLGFEQLIARAAAEATRHPVELVYAGISLGVMPAQHLAQTRPGARGALLLEACAPLTEFGTSWPDAVPAQVHGMEQDPFFAGEGDLAAARDLISSTTDGGSSSLPAGATSSPMLHCRRTTRRRPIWWWSGCWDCCNPGQRRR